MTMQANPHDLSRSKREGKAAASASLYPNYYAPRANTQDFVNGLKRQVKFEIGCWPDILKIHETSPDITAAVWCLLRETLVVCDKVPRSLKEVAAFYSAHLNDCQVLQDGHSLLLRASIVDGERVEKFILEARDFGQGPENVTRKATPSPRYQLPAGYDTLLGWILAVHQGNFARMKMLPFTLQAAPELISVMLCQYYLSRVCAVYIAKRSGLLKLVQSAKHILPTDVYLKRIEVPLGESTHPIHRFSFDPMAVSVPPEFAFAAPAPHIAQALTLWSVVMKRTCSEFISERTMSVLDQILEIAGGVPDLSEPAVSLEINRRIEEQLPALREKGSAFFVVHLMCSRTMLLDRKEISRFERLWSPKILFRDVMAPMSPPSANASVAASPIPLLRTSPQHSRRGSGDGGEQPDASKIQSAPRSSDPTSPRRPPAKEKDGSPLRSSGEGSAILHGLPASVSAPVPPASPAAVPLLPDQQVTPSRRTSARMMRTASLSQIEGLDKLDAHGHTKPVSLWDKADIQQWLISIGSKRHQKRFMEANIEGMDMMFLTHEKLETMGVRRKEERETMLRSLAMMPSAAESSGVSPASNRSLRGKSHDRVTTSVSQIFSPTSATPSADVISPSPLPLSPSSRSIHQKESRNKPRSPRRQAATSPEQKSSSPQTTPPKSDVG